MRQDNRVRLNVLLLAMYPTSNAILASYLHPAYTRHLTDNLFRNRQRHHFQFCSKFNAAHSCGSCYGDHASKTTRAQQSRVEVNQKYASHVSFVYSRLDARLHFSATALPNWHRPNSHRFWLDSSASQ